MIFMVETLTLNTQYVVSADENLSDVTPLLTRFCSKVLFTLGRFRDRMKRTVSLSWPDEPPVCQSPGLRELLALT